MIKTCKVCGKRKEVEEDEEMCLQCIISEIKEDISDLRESFEMHLRRGKHK